MSEIPCPYCGFKCEIPSNVEEKIECPNCRITSLYIQNSKSHGTIDYRPSPCLKVISEKDAEIARLKDRLLDVKDVAHVLKAFKFYLCQLTHCSYDERTAQWIIDNWEQDYKRVEDYK